MTDNPSDVSETLDQVIADYLGQVDAGEAPDRDDLINRHPEFSAELQAFFANRDHFDRAASPLRAPPQRKFVPPTIRYFGDYELLDEIARGGMGVVYKARQTRLNRTVAIKMILSGNLASDEDVRRFQREAQAAANLQHPNIVSVHEVGLHDGHHYFSMDYVDGRSLADLIRENPARPRQAAAWVRETATAIHYAHQQGTLHRDLKPSNILVDRSGRVRITDFGLAMRTTADQALTQTGQIVGTPAYMPPEQAQSKRSLIGPASDVYSLGAILYELLTGRPPFRSDSAVTTIQQVIQSEPVSPRLLNPGVPRDLETICLKCLQKEPHKRYLTAELLAEDLERFLRGEPIVARPIGRIARAWRWCRRNPLPASLASAAIGLLLTIACGATIAYLREAALHERAEGLADDLQKSYGDLSQLREIAKSLRAAVEADQAKLQDTQSKLLDAQTRTASVEGDYRELESQRRALAAVLDIRQQKLYSTLLFLAQADWDAGEVARADAYLEDCPQSLRDRRWNRLKHLCRPQMQTFA
ncbi:MAG TPA: protein kinase, partial [Planctomycetaceae bacterium]|nr:protein kinase [Planctomycetaceae bacterium]